MSRTTKARSAARASTPPVKLSSSSEIRTSRKRWTATLGVGAALGMLLASCGSDNDKADTTTAAPRAAATTTPTSAAAGASTTSAAAGASTTAAASTATTAAAPTGPFDPAKYCSAELTLETGANGLDPSKDPKAFADALLDLVQPAAALAPADLVPSFNSAIETLKSVSSTGDPSALETLETPPDVHAFDLKTCGWQRTDVVAADYTFAGLPATVKAGPHDFELTNSGKEFHVLVIVKKKAGVTESFDELLADADAESKTETILGVGADPGAPASSGVVDLQPGEYLALCPIPVGSTEGVTEATGPPHFTMGMRQTLTVT